MTDETTPKTPASEDWIEDGQLTLDHWRHRLARGQVIQCANITLSGHKNDDPELHGPGHIKITKTGDITYFIHGKTSDNGAFLKKLSRGKVNDYSALEQLRFEAVDYQGVQWFGGWTQPEEQLLAKQGWPLSGTLNHITTDVSDHWTAKTSGVELYFDRTLGLPLSQALDTETRIGGKLALKSRGGGREVFEVLGSKIIFTADPEGTGFWIRASTSADMAHPYLENWLCEALRILMGAQVFPLFSARNFGDGRGRVQLRSGPFDPTLTPIGLMPTNRRDVTPQGFWDAYRAALTMIAHDGELEAHPITQIYDELRGLWQGSNWVLSLALASATESLAKPLMVQFPPPPRFDPAAIAEMKAYVKKAPLGPVRDKILNDFAYMKGTSMADFLRDRVAHGVLPAAYVQTWMDLRNAVAHGAMVAPWATEQTDQNLNNLLGLVHVLTKLRIAPTAP